MAFSREGVLSIAVFRALKGLGDMLCCVPALRALRGAYPFAEVTLVSHPASGWVAERFPAYVDRFVDFPGWRGLPERAVDELELERFLHWSREEQLDLAIQLHGNGTLSNAIVASFGAKLTAGFVPPGFRPHPEGVFLPYPDDVHEIRRCLRLVREFGAASDDASLEFPVTAADEAEALAVRPMHGKTPYVCIHPGASAPGRRWPAEHFAHVADALRKDGFRVLLTGTPAEAGVVREVARLARADVVNLAGRTTLGGLAAVLTHAEAVVSNDTGVSHLAAALRVPSVVVFPATLAGPAADPVRWAPLDRRLHRVFHECERGTSACAPGITCLPEVAPEQVIDAARDLVARRVPNVA